jgi:hypothetical protein
MNNSEWFDKQFQANAEGMVWAIAQVPSDRLYAPPPSLLGEWSAARHLYHIGHYDRHVALPGINQWLGRPRPTFEGYNEQRDWGEGHNVENMLTDFQTAHAELLALLPQLESAQWQATQDTAWGPKTLYWVISKTFQHATEHMNHILRIALLWEHYATRSKSKEKQQEIL